MNYTIEIYLYDNKLIFTGTRDLYFEKYKGNGPGVYSNTVKIRKSVSKKSSPVHFL